jgi:hypothetical protein
VFDIPVRFEADRPERDLVTLGVVTVRLRSCARKSIEQVVEAAILLNDDDDMLDLAARGVAPDTRDCVGGRRDRRNPSAAAGAQQKRDGCGRALDNDAKPKRVRYPGSGLRWSGA